MSIGLSDLGWYEVLLEDLGGARCLSILICLRYNAWDQIVSFKTDPSEYCDFDAEAFRRDNHATELLRKNSEIPISIDRKQAAIDSFWESERACHLTNQRLYSFLKARETKVLHNESWEHYKFLEECQRLCKSILGPIPDSFNVRFSSGSTYSDRQNILPMDKMSVQPTVSSTAYEVVNQSWSHTLWSRSLCLERPYSSQPRIVLGNRFTTVPKTALTDRGICIEPSINVTHQLSVGSVIRKRLRDVGIDLKFGQSLHQRLMASASLTRELGTIDLSAASDSVSRHLVELFLPSDWFDLLNCLRSENTFIEGKWHKNAKFSSMGNGFTFELETLIFYVVCRVCEMHYMKANHIKSEFFFASRPLVYGDDIIVPVLYSKNVVNALRFLGFKTNERKTWITDHAFRESCGMDFFCGVPVRGHYLEKFPNDPIEWIKLANGIRRMAGHDLDVTGDLGNYKRAWLRVISRIPTPYRCRGPVHYGDTVIHDRESSWSVKIDKYGTEYIRTIKSVFAPGDYTSYDRKFWTRGSIVSAALLGKLLGLGDELTSFKCAHSVRVERGEEVFYIRKKPFVKPRSSASGWKTGWSVLFHRPAAILPWLPGSQ